MFTVRSRPLVAATAATLLLGTLAACGSSEAASDAEAPATGSADKVSVVAAFYPLQFAAETIGGEAVEVTNLTPPGAEPHDLELTPQQVKQIRDADLVLYIGGFQSAVDDAVAQEGGDRALDVGEGLTTLKPPPSEIEEAKEEGEAPPTSDPHIWLDPTRMATIAERVQERLVAAAPESKKAIELAGGTLQERLDRLDREWSTETKECRSRDLVVSHEAFGYLSDRYDFRQVGLSGLSPEAEPSPKRLAEVADFVRANDVTTIYFETLVDPKVANTIAQETGAKTLPLDPLEGLAEGVSGDYFSVMEDNLTQVRAGQSCA